MPCPALRVSVKPSWAALVDATHRAARGFARWVVPHGSVHRLTEEATAAVLAGRGADLTKVVRRRYQGPAGGGIVVCTREAYDTVGGIDARFLGWGGEDLSFGWALDTLVGQHERIGVPLVHLWHPHPAPNLRGSPEAEALVAQYRAARGVPRLMRAVIAGTEPEPPTVVDHPVTFRCRRPRRAIRVGPHQVQIRGGIAETVDGDVVEALRLHPEFDEAR